jgi:hypothetical protein
MAISILRKLEGIDRRWIYLAIFAAVVIPFLTGLKLPVGTPSPAAVAVFDTIDRLPEGSVVMLSFDYSPASMPELEPMAKAVVRHCFERNHRILAMTLHPQGALMIRRAVDPLMEELGKEYGVDFVDAGYKPGTAAVILGMGRDISKVYEGRDARDNALDDLHMMRDVGSYDDIALMIDFAANSLPFAWVGYAHERYGLQMGAGVTAVMATDLYPYWKSDQLVGVINGMKGAAEYEYLVGAEGWGILGMSSQSIAHLLIILFIIMGNIGYLATRRSSDPTHPGTP